MEKLELIKNNLFIGAFVSLAITVIFYSCAIYIGKKQDDIREKQHEILIKEIEESLNK